MTILKSMFAASVALTAVAAVAQDHPLTNKPMPAFTMKSLSGKVVDNASLKGKVVLFDFWASWCGPCKAASPSMQALYKKYASKGLVIVGANVNDRPGAAGEYVKEHGYTYNFTTGGEPILQKFGFQGIPAFVFMDKKGVVRKVQVGYASQLDAEFESTIKKLLAS